MWVVRRYRVQGVRATESKQLLGCIPGEGATAVVAAPVDDEEEEDGGPNDAPPVTGGVGARPLLAPASARAPGTEDAIASSSESRWWLCNALPSGPLPPPLAWPPGPLAVRRERLLAPPCVVTMECSEVTAAHSTVQPLPQPTVLAGDADLDEALSSSSASSIFIMRLRRRSGLCGSGSTAGRSIWRLA